MGPVPSDMRPTLPVEGAKRCRDALTTGELNLLDRLSFEGCKQKPGSRLYRNPLLTDLLVRGGAVDRIARAALGELAHPVRAVLFNKTAEANWSVPWHQDRTIVVRERHEVAGFGPWSRKGAHLHVEPPDSILSKMVTLRLHLDECAEGNAPLKFVPGSHRFGRIPMSRIPEFVERLGSKTCLAGVGDIWLYATAIVHSSRPAVVPSKRRVLQIDYSADDLPKPLKWFGV